MNKCIYCDNEYDKNTEHVFSKGLGGQNEYCNFVCKQCNSELSKYETELIQKSPVSMERSIQGLDGYNKNAKKEGQFKPQSLLFRDPDTNIVYECGQYGRMNIYLLPQIIYVDGHFYLDAENDENLESFSNLYKKWREKNYRMVPGHISKSKVGYYYKILETDSDFNYKLIKSEIHVSNEIRIDLVQEGDNLYEYISPRLYMDMRDPRDPKLRVRAKSENEAVQFILKLLLYVDGAKKLFPYPKRNFNDPIMHVKLTFDMLKVEKAIVKIGLNCLLHYYKLENSGDGIRPLINFILNGQDRGVVRFGEMNPIQDSVPESHNIVFFQFQDKLSVRVSLFNGSFVFLFWIENILVMECNEYSRLVIQYKKMKNTFQDRTSILRDEM